MLDEDCAKKRGKEEAKNSANRAAAVVPVTFCHLKSK